MYPETYWQRRRKNILVVAPAGATTWAVAFSRLLIPGALFTTRTAAIAYAFLLATAADLNDSSIRILSST